jgi:hypothetical protein
MSTVVVALSIALVIAVVAWFAVTTAHHLELTDTPSDGRRETPAQRFYGRHPFAPAGPDAESQRPEDTGNAWDPPPPRGHHVDVGRDDGGGGADGDRQHHAVPQLVERYARHPAAARSAVPRDRPHASPT